ncbi:ComEA family DNA-binding protein [Anaerotalea alkaliphila]|uniref:ComEA family DNA-binding protein n=1 Tax=Anaerotalea alkaliphila TaxID=2662126 RepID=A0A7X5HUJ1_9FIRM|nr:ComEA family DNA-binding protein [Anaerotalea alkaliphila]NDL66908.1 ComEA family DNA-binding protein [Anaerotalea alkaliphila]
MCDKRKMALAGAFAVFVLASGLVLFHNQGNLQGRTGFQLELGEREGAETEIHSDAGGEPLAQESLYVQVCGAVVKEGVYVLPQGVRVFEAVEAAGGLLPEAAMEGVNQARLLKDGEMIRVPTREEHARTVQEAGAAAGGLVDINRGDKKALMTLPGIGEAKAAGIIAYREQHGAFARLEDLMLVGGIKETLFKQIESMITLE